MERRIGVCTSIWVIANAGGRFRDKNLGDGDDAKVSKELTEQRFIDQADILAPGPYKQALKLKKGDRIAHLQGGGRPWRSIYGSGEFLAGGTISGDATDLTNQHINKYPKLYRVTVQYYPQNRAENRLVGIVFYLQSIIRSRLPREKVFIRPMPGQKYIMVSPGHPGFEDLNNWWNNNYQA